MIKRHNGAEWSSPYTPAVNPSGYVVTGSKHWRVHVLVAKAFLGPQPSANHTVDHIDRNRSNNNVNNLRWANKQEQVENRNKNRTRTDVVGGADYPGEEFRQTCLPFTMVSQFGRVLNSKSNKKYTPTPNAGSDYARTSDRLVHRLVAHAFPEIVGAPTLPDMTVDHIDRNKSNNRADNL